MVHFWEAVLQQVLLVTLIIRGGIELVYSPLNLPMSFGRLQF